MTPITIDYNFVAFPLLGQEIDEIVDQLTVAIQHQYLLSGMHVGFEEFEVD